MELDELKDLWAEQDKRLEANLKLNEDLLRKINLDRSRGELQKPLVYEIASSAMLIVLSVVIGAFTFRGDMDIWLFLSGVVSLVLCLVYLGFSLLKIASFNKVDCYHLNVVELQLRVEKLKVDILKYRKLEFILMPFFVFALIPILSLMLVGVNVFQKLDSLLVPFIVGLVVSVPVVIYINRNLYDKKLDNTRRFLKEIEELEK
jgi:nitrate reductase NapE component